MSHFPIPMKLDAVAGAMLWLLLGSAAIAGPDKAPVAQNPLMPTASPGPRWRVGLGAQWRSIDRLSLHVSPHARLSRFGNFVHDAREKFPGAGSAGASGNRRYGDGFVFADDGSAVDGTTWWWGYENASQVHGDSLVFLAQGTSTTASSSGRSDSLDQEFDEDGFGPILELGVDWQLSETWLAGIDFTFSWLGVDARERGQLASSSQQSTSYTITETDTYALHGIVPPAAPYAGSQDGPGPVIDATPTRSRRTTIDRQHQALLTNAAEVSLSADVYNFSLGPSVSWKRGRLTLRGRVAVELDVVSWKQSTTETAMVAGPSGTRRLAHWTDSSSGTTVVPGVGLGASAACSITPSIDLSAFAKWRAMDSFETQAGRTRASLDTSGFAVGLTLGYSF